MGCLQDKVAELKDPRCQHAVQKDAELTSKDYRLKSPPRAGPCQNRRATRSPPSRAELRLSRIS